MRSVWRSLLFVPANAPQRWAKAHTRGADCIIVDLEDSTRADAKAEARAQAADAVGHLHAQGADVIVRVNNVPEHLDADLEAVMVPGVRAILLPKVEQPVQLAAIDRRLSMLEATHRLQANSIGVIPMIESPAALERIAAIASNPRIIGLCLGSEDFSLSMGRAPTPAVLDLACQQLAYAAGARGVMGVGMAIGIGDFTDLEGWEREAGRAHAMGLTGALCIHPAQVPALNAAFAPSEQEIAEARAILAAWETASGGVVSLDGRMIDQPVAERARRLVESLR